VRVTFDTNLLVYAADTRAGHRHPPAVGLMQRAEDADCILCLQSLAEFFYAVTRKRLLTPDAARRWIDSWRVAFPVYAASEDCLVEAIDLHRRHRFPFWDALLWATAREAGCRLLLSEDFQDGLAIGGLRSVDPFAAANGPLLEAALPAAEE